MVLFYFLTNITMFKGKVYVYRNDNWKEEEFEKEFDNPQDFYEFRKNYRQPEFEGPLMWLGSWANIQNYFNNLIDRRFWLENTNEVNKKEKRLPNWVNLSKYRNVIKEIEYEKAHKAEKIQELKDTLAELKNYEETLKSHEETLKLTWREDLLKEIKKDIAATQKALDEIEK